MRNRLTRNAFITLLAASALTGLIPAAAHAAPATRDGMAECDEPYDRRETVLSVGQRLTPGQKLTSPTQSTELVMQADGNLVLYALGNPGGPRLPLWNSATYGNPGAYATMQADGNFVIYREGGSAQTGGGIWHTDTYGDRTDTNPRAKLDADGSFRVIGRRESEFMGLHFWSHNRERSTKLCANDATHEYRYRFNGDWAQSASVWMVIQPDNNLVIYRKSDGKAIWNSGTYWAKYYTMELSIADDGNLRLRDWFSPYTVAWNAGTGNNPGAYALLQDDGNFVVYKADGGPGKGGALWASGTYNQV
ncbi:hypothetical protein [Streptomyces sp. NPDC086989]|uniref:hypothetical protein n=1 Tax=Streptomyces sp. NPDC086989 TaxID=3365764 RepID=UPI00380F1378